MMSSPASTPARNRGLLVLIVALFLGSALVAGALRFSGWQPAGMRNHGALLQPPVDLRAAPMQQMDGQPYAWQPATRTWRIAVAPPPGCQADCASLSAQLDTVWQLFGREADRVHTLWIGELPADMVRNRSLRHLQADQSLRQALPGVDDPAGPPLYVIDPNGFVILRYPPGSDPGDLRADMARLLKLK